jgi:hypothetical protein
MGGAVATFYSDLKKAVLALGVPETKWDDLVGQMRNQTSTKDAGTA